METPVELLYFVSNVLIAISIMGFLSDVENRHQAKKDAQEKAKEETPKSDKKEE